MLKAAGLNKSYRHGRQSVAALREVSLRIDPAEAVGIVGPSGCGKTTLVRCLLRLESLDSGSIQFGQTDWLALGGRQLRRMRPRMGAIFQDPFASLNPRQRVGQIIEEPLRVSTRAGESQRRQRIGELVTAVGLTEELLDRRPERLSGGQRQRVAIARALAAGPQLLVADEPTSALDAPVRLQILELLKDLQRSRELAALIVSHDFSVVRAVCDRVAVMVNGLLVEIGPTEAVFSEPHHAWTRWLLEAMPAAGRPIGAATPPPAVPPPGPWQELGDRHRVRQMSS